MNWHRVLVEWPAKAFTAWWTAYSMLLAVLIMVLFTVGIIAIFLDQAFGIRWGW